MIYDEDFSFLIRLAYTLRKTITEVLALPMWELELWKSAFLIYGPLDWRREDLLFASLAQMQSTGTHPLSDFVLFQDPLERIRKEEEAEKPENILARFGVVE